MPSLCSHDQTLADRYGSTLEGLLVRFCAPTLAGIKTAGLFTAPCPSREALLEELRGLNHRLAGDRLRLLPLRIRDGKALLYLYREEQLGRDLAEAQAESLLSARGYPRCSPGGRLACLRRRLGTQREFPHEIGLFLGYPPEDVAGFIDHSARDYTYSGLWKVYGDAQQAKLTFDRYRRSTDRCCRLWRQGLKLEEILARKAQIQ